MGRTNITNEQAQPGQPWTSNTQAYIDMADGLITEKTQWITLSIAAAQLGMGCGFVHVIIAWWLGDAVKFAENGSPES